MKLARQGRKDALEKLCIAAELFIASLCNRPKFANQLGRDEVRSIASLKLIEFFLSENKNYPDQDMPRVIQKALREKLIDDLRSLDTRRSHEVITDDGMPGYVSATADCATELLPASAGEPESCLLENALACEVKEAIKRLSKKEQAVIYGIFFHQKNTVKLARELHCTSQNVGYIKRTALARLGLILKRPVNA